MKKYWKLITLVTVVALTIGTMYIGGAIEASKYPTFVMEHEHGNEAEAEKMMIDAQYEVEDDYLHPKITTEGTTYNVPASYIDLLNDHQLPAEMKRLQKEYRNFMRGKDQELSKYFEDQNYLVYVTINYDHAHQVAHERKYVLEIDVLDKQTNKTASFNVPISVDEQHDYMNMQKIQLLNDQLKVFTVNDLVTDVEQIAENEIHLYSIDIKNGKLINDEVIDVQTEYKGEDHYISIYTVDYDEKIGPNKYIVYTIDVNKDVNDRQKLLERQLIAYNLETNEQKKITFPDDYDGETHPLALDDSIIYFIKESADNIEVIGYDLDKQQIETKQTFIAGEMEDDVTSRYVFEKNKIYIVHQPKVGKIDSKVIIGDPKTGEILYEGSIKLAQSSKSEKINHFYMSRIDVTKE